MDYKELTEEELTEFFLDEPELIVDGLADDEIVHLHEHRKFKHSRGSTFSGIVNHRGNLIAVLRWEYFTSTTLNVHLYLRKSLRNTGVVGDIYGFICQHLKAHTDIRKLISLVPRSCVHVQKSLTKYGGKQEGCLTQSVIWRNKIEDLLIYSMNLYGEEL